jgi:hypothetical protein
MGEGASKLGTNVGNVKIESTIDANAYDCGNISLMKTTLDIPDSLFRRAKSMALSRGIPLREFVIEAVKDKLAASGKPWEKPWLKHMGKLRHLRKETARINHRIENDSERIDIGIWGCP